MRGCARPLSDGLVPWPNLRRRVSVLVSAGIVLFALVSCSPDCAISSVVRSSSLGELSDVLGAFSVSICSCFCGLHAAATSGIIGGVLLYFVQPVVSQHIGRGCAFGWIQPQHWEKKGFNFRRSGFIEIFCQQKVANGLSGNLRVKTQQSV